MKINGGEEIARYSEVEYILCAECKIVIGCVDELGVASKCNIPNYNLDKGEVKNFYDLCDKPCYFMAQKVGKHLQCVKEEICPLHDKRKKSIVYVGTSHPPHIIIACRKDGEENTRCDKCSNRCKMSGQLVRRAHDSRGGGCSQDKKTEFSREFWLAAVQGISNALNENRFSKFQDY